MIGLKLYFACILVFEPKKMMKEKEIWGTPTF
jgi:predicted RNA-binding protein